ncbi:MAG: phosphoribosylaminoimidazole-succinocarboxamide synthase [Candidatus Saganbacteria bacterium]|uniref:Phosphoribosylaminoimidazole-succinocarboxamide synthase n=1 Tax=Candidatus Saganbacteria bacterium TaxID=2575572 RepID=A0A833L3M9_UNCSA|nr:MAG: phosphoribosylaminoimidazole-succinocarboxamide synthase [Candidatus Saganbacteria bacterium]
MNQEAVLKVELEGISPPKRGKVREVYDLGNELLIIATDRISAFDYIMPNGIPDKGKILTQISLFWFDYLKDIIPNHLITADTNEFPEKLQTKKELLEKRSMICKKAKVIPVECVVRGYLSGSGWAEYQKSRSICGIKLNPGLVESDKLPEPIFTPTTKAEAGHDQNITEKEVEDIIGKETAQFIKQKTIAIYTAAAEYADKKEIIIADTKFEFGIYQDKIILIDEVLTPDSSRFWPKEKYKAGGAQPSFDKQFVRDYLLSIKWNKEPPAPLLPEEVVEKTREKYMEAFIKLTGKINL